MNKLLRFALATALVTTVAAPAAAGELRLSMANGLVTLIAKDVTVREILAEWAASARRVNAEKLAGGGDAGLTDVPEARALDAVLRSAAGTDGAAHGRIDRTILCDRILIRDQPRTRGHRQRGAFTNRAMPPMPQNNVNPGRRPSSGRVPGGDRTGQPGHGQT
jgi:hypothetical protein